MANKLNGFLDNVLNGVLNPKGNLGDFQHAARLFTDDYFRLAPKTKFLYHVVFNINPAVKTLGPGYDKIELNMLVKAAELPKFNLETSVVNQYNRKKIVTTKINYDPISITFHDDNNNTTTDMWKAYYKYMFADGNYQGVGFSEDTSGNPQGFNSAYSLNPYDQYTGAYGLDYNTAGSKKRFFTSIQISQLSRHRHFTYTLINPVINSWSHDDVAAGTSEPAQSQMSVSYEAVLYHNPGTIKPDTPTGFAERHYDKQFSPITPAGGGSATLFGAGGVVEGVANIFDLVGSGRAFSSVGGFLEAVVTGANTYKNFKQLNSSGLAEETAGIISRGLQTNVSVSGLTDTTFPKASVSNLVEASINTEVTANKGSTVGNNVSQRQSEITSSIKKLDDFTVSTVYKTEYINEYGVSDINTIKTSYDALSENSKQSFRDIAIQTINQELRSS